MAAHHRTEQSCEAAAVVGYVRAHGGTVDDAIASLGLRPSPALADRSRGLLERSSDLPAPPVNPFEGLPR